MGLFSNLWFWYSLSRFSGFAAIFLWQSKLVFFLIKEILAPENAELTGEMVRWLIPGIILQGINFQ
jgi:hypothetical protein